MGFLEISPHLRFQSPYRSALSIVRDASEPLSDCHSVVLLCLCFVRFIAGPREKLQGTAGTFKR